MKINKKKIYIHKSILKNLNLKKNKIWNKSTTILPLWIHKNILVYNGKDWKKIRILPNMIGKKIGMFCTTRIQTKHKVKKK